MKRPAWLRILDFEGLANGWKRPTSRLDRLTEILRDYDGCWDGSPNRCIPDVGKIEAPVDAGGVGGMMDTIASVLGFLGLWLAAYLLIAGLIFGCPIAWRWTVKRWRRFRHEARLRWVEYCRHVVEAAYVEENIGWLAQVGGWELEADGRTYLRPKERRRKR